MALYAHGIPYKEVLCQCTVVKFIMCNNVLRSFYLPIHTLGHMPDVVEMLCVGQIFLYPLGYLPLSVSDKVTNVQLCKVLYHSLQTFFLYVEAATTIVRLKITNSVYELFDSHCRLRGVLLVGQEAYWPPVPLWSTYQNWHSAQGYLPLLTPPRISHCCILLFLPYRLDDRLKEAVLMG